MNRNYIGLLLPVLLSSIVSIGLYVLPLRTIGVITRYTLGSIAVMCILLYILVGGYSVLLRLLTEISGLAWGDIIQRHLDNNETFSRDELPHWSRLWIAYIAMLLRSWLKGNFTWVTYSSYYEDMVSPLLEESST
jgi:hypothetical protein